MELAQLLSVIYSSNRRAGSKPRLPARLLLNWIKADAPQVKAMRRPTPITTEPIRYGRRPTPVIAQN